MCKLMFDDFGRVMCLTGILNPSVKVMHVNEKRVNDLTFMPTDEC